MFIRMSAQAVELTVRRINDAIQKLVAIGRPPVILVNPRIRPGLRMLIANELPRVRVLSYNEVTQDTTMESVAVVTDSGSLKPAPN
jgi:flagellar biosynthesis protein FlhA